VVYDDTPVINTVSPTSVTLGTATSLTIGGVAFGTRPTIYVNGVACSATGTMCVYNGSVATQGTQDQATVTVTLQQGASISIYLVSDGAGPDPFLGPPISAGQGSATSNTKTISAAPPPPTINSITPSTFHVGVTGVQFEIDGSNFYFGTQGQPTISFAQPPPGSTAGCGLANVVVNGNYTSSRITGTFDTTQAVAGNCTVTVTQYQSAQSASQTFTITPGPPTISGSSGIWYLGKAVVNDNCNLNSEVPNCYYTSTLLVWTAGAGGSGPSPQSPAVWTLTDPSTGQAPTFANYQCSPPEPGSDCSSIIVTATGQPLCCGVSSGSLNLTVTLGAVTSGVFQAAVDWPQSTNNTGHFDIPAPGSIPGFLSTNTLQLLSGRGLVMYNIDWHEEFPTDSSAKPANWHACNNSTGFWTSPIPIGGWAHGTTDGTGILQPSDPRQGFDGVGIACGTGVSPFCSPSSNIPGPEQTPPQPFSTTAQAWSYQFIFVGSQDTQALGKDWPAAPNKQVRYTDNGRDEVGTWSNCPGQQ